jgi:hypothetical protein
LSRIATLEEENTRLKEAKDIDERDVVTKMLASANTTRPVTAGTSPLEAGSRVAVSKKRSNVDAMGSASHFIHPDTKSDSYFGYSSTSAMMDQVMRALSTNNKEDSAQSKPQTFSLPIGIDNAMFEADYVGPENFSLFPRPVTDFLLNRYWEKVHSLYPIIHKPTFMQSYERLWNASAKPAPKNPALGLGESGAAGPLSFPFHIALNAMLVLGLQWTTLDPAGKDNLVFQCIQKAKNLMKLDLFNDGSFAILQMMLLLAHYFQSTSSPNKSWVIVGISARIAQALGLHMDASRSVPHPLERELRRRTWYATIIFDMMTSMILGRPVMLRRSHAVPIPSPTDDEYLLHNVPQPENHISDLLFFSESIKLHKVMRDSLATLYKEKLEGAMQKLDKTVELDTTLSKLEEELPDALNWNKPFPTHLRTNRTTLEQQRNVLHIRFLAAHFGLHRPLFIEYFRTKQEARSFTTPSSTTKFLEQSQRCAAVVCVQQAMKMMNAIVVYAGTDATCEWWYSMFFIRLAAAVFILTKTRPELVTEIGHNDIDTGWHTCRDVLVNKLPQNELVISCCEGLDRMYNQVQPPAKAAGDVSSNSATMFAGANFDPLNGDVFNDLDSFNFVDSESYNWNINYWSAGFDESTQHSIWP